MSESRNSQIEHFVAELDETGLADVDELDTSTPPASLWKEAWSKLWRQPIFIVSGVLVLLIVTIAAFPSWFSSGRINCELSNSEARPTSGHIMGFDKQGCDIYADVIFGARPSVLVGVLSMLSVLVLGGVIGSIAGWYGRWADAVLSRLGDIFFAIPIILAAIVFLSAFKDRTGVISVVAIIAIFGWPQMARITRGAVLSLKNADFVTASRALGVSRFTILRRHILPNAAAPMIVTATVALGTYIVLEATLSFLGLGLPLSMRSWGYQISMARDSLKTAPHVLLFPSIALAITVLAFIMLGDAVRDALDPKVKRG
ncbi:MAG: ABC transporter permease [Micrococcales bacterium]|nr:ABC transporter permease [Micrococcales bacterium]